MIRRFEYTPILGWSISRYDTFSMCKRQYYYQYYGKFDLEFDRNLVNLLKGLTSIPLEIGNVSHEVISVLLKRLQKTSQKIDHERFLDFTRRKTLEIARGKNFSEVYYREKEFVNAEEEILPRVSLALTNLLESDRLEWLFNEALSTKDEWIIEPEGYGECRIDNQKAYCKVDFLFPIGDEVHIYDWKTGKQDAVKHEKQMKGYATWAHFHLGVDYTKVRSTVAYLLPDYLERSVSLNEFDIESFSQRIKTETEEMYRYLQDIDQNLPLAKSEFPLTENRNICRFCNYRELCGRE